MRLGRNNTLPLLPLFNVARSLFKLGIVLPDFPDGVQSVDVGCGSQQPSQNLPWPDKPHRRFQFPAPPATCRPSA